MNEIDPERAAQPGSQSRLLSHRLRGFGPAEGSIHNLRAALAAGVRLIEIDTRHTRDAQIVIHHAPVLGTLTTGPQRLIKDVSLEELRKTAFRRMPSERVPTLEAFLDVARQTPDLELWIDIKDFGLEERYVELVREHQLYRRVRLISWIPQTLLRLHRLDGEIKLGFSYACTARLRLLHLAVRTVAVWTGRQSKPLFGGFRLRHRPDLSAVIPVFHPLPEELTEQVEPVYAKGYNHAHVIPGLPQGRLFEVLAANRGVVGMFTGQATPAVVGQAHEAGLSVCVYSVDSRRRLAKLLAGSPVDVVFSNNADLVRRMPTAPRRPRAGPRGE